MNRKTFTYCLTLALSGGVAFTTSNLFAVDNAGVALHVAAGGQGAPAAQGGSGFTVKVASGMDRAAAESMQADLKNEGFTQAELRAAGSGYDVVIGELAARAQAESVVADLKKAGYTTDVEIVGAGPGAVAAEPGGAIYRVQVASFDTAEEANEASKVLVTEGFVNVDVVEDSGKHLLMLGTFNKEADAKALLGDVSKAGFALADVVKRDRVAGSGSSVGSADLTGLSSSEQEKTRAALSLAEKVESGAATAAEMKQLRDMIQQMSGAQKAVIGKQESNRSSEQDKMQKVYPLYRQFEAALRSNNFDEAEKLLAQVQQINPNDIFLPGKLSVLEAKRSGKLDNAGAPTNGSPDPAVVQRMLNEARITERTGDKSAALQKYKAVLDMDSKNSEARGKIAELESVSPTVPAAAPVVDDDMKQKLMYGGGILAALIIVLLVWLKKRGGKSEPIAPSSGMSYNTGPDFIDPLASSGGYDTSMGAVSDMSGSSAESSMMAGAGMAGMASFPIDDDGDVEDVKPAPAPVKTPVQEDESVSMDVFDMSPASTPVELSAVPDVPIVDDNAAVDSINFDEEVPLPEASLSAPEPLTIEEPVVTSGKGAMDADLEALLKGTFPGAPTEEPGNFDEMPTVMDDVMAGVMSDPAPNVSAPEMVFAQTFEDGAVGSAAEEWRGEYDYASLTVAEVDGEGHNKVLMFDKQEGAGSATYHLKFPNASGRVTAEFDIRCDKKNKFLLGVYFEKDEDFKQSIHTIVHQLDADGPASLRIQGEGHPYAMSSWVHVKYIIDLNVGTINAYMDNEQVVDGLALTVVPEYINTLSIRDNLATTGTLYLDNIQVWEG